MTLKHDIIQHSEVVPNEQQRARLLLHFGRERHHDVMSIALRWENGAGNGGICQEGVLFFIEESKGAGRLTEIDVLYVVVSERREHVDDGVRPRVVVEKHRLNSHGVV